MPVGAVQCQHEENNVMQFLAWPGLSLLFRFYTNVVVFVGYYERRMLREHYNLLIVYERDLRVPLLAAVAHINT